MDSDFIFENYFITPKRHSEKPSQYFTNDPI